MTRAQFNRLRRACGSQTDYVRALLPWHLGGAYAYLANDLTIGAMVAVGFLLLTKLGD